MTRKQLGMIDHGLLDRVDARAAELGQTRRVFTERALQAALDGPLAASAHRSRERAGVASPLPPTQPPARSADSGHSATPPVARGVNAETMATMALARQRKLNEAKVPSHGTSRKKA